MNQVTEMLRLDSAASESDAVARLSTLFEMMRGAKGFYEAEVLRSTDQPGLLLVLHAWDSIEDWHAFQASDAKIAFSAGRPPALYRFLPCGMNWLLREGAAAAGTFLRREVIRERLEPYAGPDVVSSQTFSYQDYEPSLTGAMLRLTRLNAARDLPKLTGERVIADEVYESLLHRSRAGSQARESLTAGR